MAYPTLSAQSSTIQALTRNEIQASDGGTIRGQDLNADNYYRIVITHEPILPADVTTLQDYFDANRNTVITTTTLSDQNTYECLLVTEPVIDDISKTHKKAVWTLEGVRN